MYSHSTFTMFPEIIVLPFCVLQKIKKCAWKIYHVNNFGIDTSPNVEDNCFIFKRLCACYFRLKL